jgi:cyclic pyranopterin phosphate synthase
MLFGFDLHGINDDLFNGIGIIVFIADEVVDLVLFAQDLGIDISFIEEMPLGLINSHNRAETYYSSDQIKADLDAHFNLQKITDKTAGPSAHDRF